MENQRSSPSSKSPPSTPTSKDKRIKLTPAPVARPIKPSKSNIIERRPWLRGVTIEPMQKPKETTGKKKVQHHTQKSDQQANNDGSISFLVPKEFEKNLQEKKKPHEDGWTDQGHKEFLVGLSKYPKGDWEKISKKCVKAENPQQVQEHAELASKTHLQSSNVITYTKKIRRNSTVRDVAKSTSSPANNPTSSAKIDSTSQYLVHVASKSISNSPTNNTNIARASYHLLPAASNPSSSSLANNASTSTPPNSTTNCQVPFTAKSSIPGPANTVSISNYVPAASDAANYIASSFNYQQVVPVAAATSIASSGTNVVDQSAILSMANRSEVDIIGQYSIETLNLFPRAPPRPTLIMFPVTQPYFPVRPQIRSSGAFADYLYGSNLYHHLPAGTTMTMTPHFSPSPGELDLDLRLG